VTECNLCGDCCDPVPLAFSKADARRRLDTEYVSPRTRANLVWVLTRLRRISRAEAARRRPGAEHATSGGAPTNFYECLDFDPVARACTAYDRRPPICHGYPWYGRAPAPVTLPLRCSFWADVPAAHRPPEWVPIALVTGT
jgi:Fe-S-cluster containining protein